MIHTRYESCTITLLNNVTYCDTNREFKDITIFNTNKNREFNDITIFDMNKNRDYHDANHEFNDITMFNVDNNRDNHDAISRLHVAVGACMFSRRGLGSQSTRWLC